MRLSHPDRHRLDPEDERNERAVAPVRPALGADAVLRLQSQLGNHAVSRLLARSEEQAGAKESVATLAGIGQFPVSSFQLNGNNTLSLTLDAGNAAQRLFRASSTGEPIASATIASAGHVITLTDALVTSFQQSNDRGGPPLTTVELTGTSLDVK